MLATRRQQTGRQLGQGCVARTHIVRVEINNKKVAGQIFFFSNYQILLTFYYCV